MAKVGDIFKSKPATEIPDEKVELAVEEDRARLIVQAMAMLALNLLMLFVGLGCFGAAQITGNMLYLAGVILAVTVVWFVSKRMGRFFGKFAYRLDAIDFLERHVVIYERGSRSDAIVVAYKDIKNYKLIRQGKALRLLLSGAWVGHPSGYQLVDINRPFMAGTLDGLEGEIEQLMRRHHVSERRKR